ncbi:MAG TPA: LiaF domain-containing protein [Longimicrobium sp.]
MSDLRRPARAVLALTAAAVLAGCGHEAEANQRSHRMRSITSARQVQGEKALDVRVQYGFGTLEVQPAAGDLLYRMDLRYDDQQFRPVSEYDRAAGKLRLGVEGRERGGRGEHGDAEDEHASVSLAPSVPMDLSLQFGAGKTEAELGGMSLTSLSLTTGASNTVVAFSRPNRVPARQVNVQAGAAELRMTGLGNTRAERFEFQGGVGQATLDFSGAWDRNATARVQMGVGAVRLRLPRSLGVRVSKSSFLSSFDPTEMVKQGNAWYSRNWSQAPHRLEISIDAAVGSIDIDWVD